VKLFVEALVLYYDWLCFSHSKLISTDLLSGTQQKRDGRGITQMNDIFLRTADMPKIKVTLNEYGQPVGETARKLASVIGCQVRKKLSIGCKDWRLVDPKKKIAVWNDIKVQHLLFSTDFFFLN